MDRELIEQKLESLLHCVQRIQHKCPEDANALVRDLDAEDIVSLGSSEPDPTVTPIAPSVR